MFDFLGRNKKRKKMIFFFEKKNYFLTFNLLLIFLREDF